MSLKNIQTIKSEDGAFLRKMQKDGVCRSFVVIAVNVVMVGSVLTLNSFCLVEMVLVVAAFCCVASGK